MAESTTMSSMTSPEPTAMGDALAPWMRKLQEMGLEPGQPSAGPTPPTTEDPEDAARRRQAKLDNYASRWLALVPVMFQTASVEDLDDDQNAGQVRAWLRSGSLNLILAGAVGTGKTFAAYAIGNQALASGMWVEAWHAGDLLDAMRPASTDRSAEGRARDCDLLILDDLTAKATDWEAERLNLILDARVREERQTVVTTNVTGAQITEAWGTRFMDRLRYRMTLLTFTGSSRRQTW